MKLSIKNILVAASLMLPVCAAAQNTRTGYFLEDYTYRFQMNPALANTKKFVAIPVLGNFNFGLSGNIGLNDVLYNVDGRTTTFLNPKVPASEVLSRIHDSNRIDMEARIQLIGVGFNALRGYNTVSVSARTMSGVKLPGSIFSFFKEGVENKSYDLSNVKAYGTAFVEVSLGHSRQLLKDLRVGANVKVLVGASNLYANLKQAQLNLDSDHWHIVTEADVDVNMKGFEFKTERSESTGNYYVNDVHIDKGGVAGYGLAFDLGATYVPFFMKDLEFSLAVLDLGFISWNNDMRATTNGVKAFDSDEYTFNVSDSAPNSFKGEWKQMKKGLMNLYELQNVGDQGGQAKALGATVNVGALYTFPYYRNLKFGLLNTTRINGSFSWTDFRLSANVMPCRIFDASVSANAGTFGVGFGWLLNVHCSGFNFFLGEDCMVGKLAKQGIPLNSNAQFNLGLNYLF